MKSLLKQATDLYRESFSDGESYIKYFFENKFKPANFLFIEENGQILSELFLVEKRLFIRGKVLPFPYVVGACTKKNRQGEGLMSRLLIMCFNALEARGIWVTGLFPFRHSFYEKQGFITLNRMKEKPIKPDEALTIKEFSESEIGKLADFYNSECAKSDIYILRTETEFYEKIKEVEAATGKTYLAYKDDLLTGYIMFDSEEITEAMGTGWQGLPALNGRSYNFPDEKGEKYAMFRLIKAAPLLPFLNYPTDICSNVNIRVTDAFRRTEDEIFTLSVEGGKAVLTPSESYNYTLTIEEMTLLVTGAYAREGYLPPAELAEIFPPTKPLIFDKY
jgi:hypothetical protein